MAVTVPDPPTTGAHALRSIDGVVAWVPALIAPEPPDSTGDWVLVYLQGSYRWQALTSIRGAGGLPGLRGAVGPGGSTGADGRNAPGILVNLVSQ